MELCAWSLSARLWLLSFEWRWYRTYYYLLMLIRTHSRTICSLGAPLFTFVVSFACFIYHHQHQYVICREFTKLRIFTTITTIIPQHAIFNIWVPSWPMINHVVPIVVVGVATRCIVIHLRLLVNDILPVSGFNFYLLSGRYVCAVFWCTCYIICTHTHTWCCVVCNRLHHSTIPLTLTHPLTHTWCWWTRQISLWAFVSYDTIVPFVVSILVMRRRVPLVIIHPLPNGKSNGMVERPNVMRNDILKEERYQFQYASRIEGISRTSIFVSFETCGWCACDATHDATISCHTVLSECL